MDRSPSSTLTTSNFDTRPTAVEIWGYPFDASEPTFSRRFANILGLSSIQVSLASLMQEAAGKSHGTLWLRSSSRLLVTANSTKFGQVTAVPAELNYVFNGTPFFTAGGQKLVGSGLPSGNGLLIVIQNLSAIVAAKVQLDIQQGGQLLKNLSGLIAPRTARLFTIPKSAFASGGVEVDVNSVDHSSPNGPVALQQRLNGYAISGGQAFPLTVIP